MMLAPELTTARLRRFVTGGIYLLSCLRHTMASLRPPARTLTAMIVPTAMLESIGRQLLTPRRVTTDADAPKRLRSIDLRAAPDTKRAGPFTAGRFRFSFHPMRSDWRREFKELGVDQVRAKVNASTWAGDKLQAARRWLWWQEHRLQIAAVIVAAVAAAASVATFIVDRLK